MARPLATAFVRLVPDPGGFGAAMKAELAGSGKDAEAAGANVGDSYASGLKSKMVKISNAISLGLAAAGVGLAVNGVRMASTFQSDMETLVTQAGVAQGKIKGLSAGVLSLAGQVGFAPDSLADALYHIESAFGTVGITGAKAMSLLRIAAEGAATGHANLTDVTNALDAAIVAGVKGTGDFAHAMGVLNSIVGVGDMKMQDLALAFGTGVLASIKGFGVTLDDAGAALATFGDNNIRGAKAGTELRMAVQALAAPTSAGIPILAKLGITANQLAVDMQKGGLKLAIEDLVDHMKKMGLATNQQGQILTEVFGKKAGVGIQILTGQVDRFLSKYPALDKGASGFGTAWDHTQSTVTQQVHEMGAAFDAVEVRIGEKLIPVVVSLFTFVKSHIDVVLALAGVIGGLALTISTVSFAMKAWKTAQELWTGATKVATGAMGLFASATEATTDASGEAVAAQEAGAGRIAAGWVASAAKAVWSGAVQVGQWIATAAKAVWSAGVQVASWVATAAAATAAFIAENAAMLGIGLAIAALVAAVVFLVTHWRQAWAWIKSAAEDVWDWIKDNWPYLTAILTGPVGLAVGFIVKHWTEVKSTFEALWNYIWTDFGQKIANFFTKTLPGWLHTSLGDINTAYVQPVEHIFEDLYQWVWTDFGAKVEAFFVHMLPGWFMDGVHNIGAAFDKIEDVLKVPVNWVLQYIYDDGIRAMWDFVAGIVGLPKLPMVQPLAAGGRMPGYGGGDSILALLEPGETVVPKNLTPEIAAWAKSKGIPGFASGGIIGGIGDTVKIIAALASGNAVALEHAFTDLFGKPPGVAGQMAAAVVGLPAIIVKDLVAKAIKAFATSGQAIVEYAESFVGKVPYLWGHDTPAGWDCSGMTEYIYQHFGYSTIPRTAAEQQQWVQSTKAPVPGGLAFFAGADGTAAAAGHVGIIVGANKMVDAYGTGYGTRYNDIYGDSGAVGGFGIPPGGFGNRTSIPALGHDTGGWLPPGLSLAINNTGQPEQVLPPGAGIAGDDDLYDLLSDLPDRIATSLANALNGVARTATYRAMYSAR